MTNKILFVLTFLIHSFLYSQNVGTDYCGPYTISQPIVYNNIHNTTISGLEITNPNGHCIILNNCSNIIIENCLLKEASGNAVNIENSNGITVTNCNMESVSTGVYVQGQSSQIQVLYNTCKNVNGPFPRGQLTQFNGVSGTGNKINYNVAENIIEDSYPEDIINIYNSNGTAADPIQIKGNWIRGGGPSTSGGGILIGDNGGSYTTVEDNILVNPGQYGLAVAGGNNMILLNNTVFGEQNYFTNVGLYVWDQYQSSCSYITVSGNQVNWTHADGYSNNAWDGNNCGVITDWDNNTWNANIDDSILPNVIDNCNSLGVVDMFQNEFTFFPNPTDGLFSIKFEELQDNITIQVLSVLGQVVQKENFQNTNQIRLHINQSSGIYFVKIIDSKNRQNIMRVIKQ
ncbi:right-handed parallel beta-helix repeat-containing protein [Olleya sp. YSTF-M6]|uniref:Right-handed parallel beta-helix repeat-containing protein n=1 Tax=Olleya sediminilitoris TaxID=2795739 RepID=A0ABS1WM19_9FLAO|nr:T9SS type A sorting domain-containing protein [Olleya sediminilitoris]MBL7560177.1 right-handed parallel beta-helix repeat-containing protein [Olleya sediminilitoris]